MKKLVPALLLLSLLFSFTILFSSCSSKVNVTFVTYNKDNFIYLEVDKGRALNYFPKSAKTGFNFVGWSLSETEKNLIDKDYCFDENTTLYAYYEIEELAFAGFTMEYDGSNTYEKLFYVGKRAVLIKNAQNNPIYGIKLTPSENSKFENWYITATSEIGRKLENTGLETDKITFANPVYGDILFEFEVITQGRVNVSIIDE